MTAAECASCGEYLGTLNSQYSLPSLLDGPKLVQTGYLEGSHGHTQIGALLLRILEEHISTLLGGLLPPGWGVQAVMLLFAAVCVCQCCPRESACMLHQGVQKGCKQSVEH